MQLDDAIKNISAEPEPKKGWSKGRLAILIVSGAVAIPALLLIIDLSLPILGWRRTIAAFVKERTWDKYFDVHCPKLSQEECANSRYCKIQYSWGSRGSFAMGTEELFIASSTCERK